MRVKLIFINLFISYTIYSQSIEKVNIRMDDFTKIYIKNPLLKSEDIIDKLSIAVNEYADLGRLRDFEEDGSVTQLSCQRFKKLFAKDNMLINNDIKNSKEDIKLDEYVDLVYDKMKESGLFFSITDAYLKQIAELDTKIIAIIRINKLNENGISWNKIKWYNSPKLIELEFFYTISLDLSLAKIEMLKKVVNIESSDF